MLDYLTIHCTSKAPKMGTKSQQKFKIKKQQQELNCGYLWKPVDTSRIEFSFFLADKNFFSIKQ